MRVIEVETTAGRVRGQWEDGVAVFRGVPFAAAPVGANRFAAPSPAAPWAGARDAFEFGAPPPQPGRSKGGDEWLNLTVWTPEPGQAVLPVILWISGGGYLACDSANPHLAGGALSRAGVVVVSAHYRSGAEGFLHLDGAPDNRGLLDQLAALTWVHDNIARFGGDAGNVTAFGQSAGAGCIAALLTMPAAAGAFGRAILQSIPGTYFTAGLAADISTEICAELGHRPTATDLAGVAPDDLMAASLAIKARLPQRADRWGAVAFTPTPFSPVVDGEVLTTAPWEALAAGAAADVDLMIGHGRDEYSLLAAQLPHITDGELDALIDRLTPTPGARRYRQTFPTASADDLRELALSDWLFRMPALHLAEAADRGGTPVWLYELRWGYGPQGASHSLDTLLVFGTTDIYGEVSAAGPAAVAQAQQVSTSLRGDHLAFVATGEPGWPRFSRNERLTRLYGVQPSVACYPEEQSRTIWNDQTFAALNLKM
ncbi:MAG: carboxylesterase family protein [Actinomycetota bacterium]|nr:carboxylesterase family protein [Actinomycetota bacterium]